MTYEPYGAYFIPDDVYPEFMEKYENAIVAGYEPHITEKQEEIGQIVIDFDFVQSKENSDRYYSETTIKNIIIIYNAIINEYREQLDISDGGICAYVMEKKQPDLRKSQYQDGIHIVYPYVLANAETKIQMRQVFLEMAKKYDLFKEIPMVNSIEDAVDKYSVLNNWMMYGSTKNSISLVYRVTHIYTTNSNGNVKDHVKPFENLNDEEHIRDFIYLLACRKPVIKIE